jgi:hypothetical protein
MLLDESYIARESQNSPAPARASDRLLSICIHEKHDIVSFFLGRHPPAGAALRILRSSLGRAGGSAEARGAVFTKNIASCNFFLANAVCWCCDSHPANQSWKETGAYGPRPESHCDEPLRRRNGGRSLLPSPGGALPTALLAVRGQRRPDPFFEAGPNPPQPNPPRLPDHREGPTRWVEVDDQRGAAEWFAQYKRDIP